MSRTTSNYSADRVKNPAKYTLEWHAGGDNMGKFSFWDRELKESVYLDDLEIIVLDRVNSITGYDKESKSRIYSNYVYDTNTQPFTIRSTNGILVQGLYQDIKHEAFKFTINVFCLVKINDDWELCNLQLTKSGTAVWSDFVKEVRSFNLWNYIVLAKANPEVQRNGATKYMTIDFSTAECPDELKSLADTYDAETLQPFLSQFRNTASTNDSADNSEDN